MKDVQYKMFATVIICFYLRKSYGVWVPKYLVSYQDRVVGIVVMAELNRKKLVYIHISREEARFYVKPFSKFNIGHRWLRKVYSFVKFFGQFYFYRQENALVDFFFF